MSETCTTGLVLPAELTDLGCVIGSTEDQFRSPVIPRANIGHIRLILHQDLCAAKVAQLEYTGSRVKQKVLRLDIAMADSLRMDICQSSEQLVGIELDFQDRHSGLHFVEEP